MSRRASNIGTTNRLDRTEQRMAFLDHSRTCSDTSWIDEWSPLGIARHYGCRQAAKIGRPGTTQSIPRVEAAVRLLACWLGSRGSCTIPTPCIG